VGAAIGLALSPAIVSSATTLADQPVFSTSVVPGNLALALSVEWPTASRTAHVGDYSSAATYLGYFDPGKCYTYFQDLSANGVSSLEMGDSSYFQPAGRATGHRCTGQWSGNFLNWAATATIDPFRWAMTGGRRVVDEVGKTILEKNWQADRDLFPDRALTPAEIAGATPMTSATSVQISVRNRGFKMRVTSSGQTTRGMTGEYFGNRELTGAPITVASDTAYHDWGGGNPVGGIGADNFGVRYSGTFTVPTTGNYRFRTVSDDGVRVWVDPTGSNNFSDANRVIDNYIDHGPVTDTSDRIALTAGTRFSIKVEYFESGGGAVLQLLWRKPGEDYTTFTEDGGSGAVDYTMRVKVCDPSTAAGGLEANCKAYGDNNYKPEGLIQQYADKMRYSAFGYLNDSSGTRDGAVLRARQKFVGPTYPRPGTTPGTNSSGTQGIGIGGMEWSPVTGMMVQDPDHADALATGVSDSGVMNYLNKFGQVILGSYKDYDPVNELYYAVLRYYRNLGNVDSWSNMDGAGPEDRTKWIDGFPVVTNWNDPIQYSCQRNFVLGIGDIYTWNDKNIPGNTRTDSEPVMPAEVRDDPINASTERSYMTATDRVGVLQGMGTILSAASTGAGGSSYYMAGMAFDANALDIRPDLPNKQTVQTYWVDVLEQPFQSNNKFYLAAKFGGLNQKKLPEDFNPYTYDTAVPQAWWSTSGETLTDYRNNETVARPDNYFAAGQPATMVAGLRQAFERISNEIDAYTTSFSVAGVQVQSTGAASYGAQYDAKDWTGTVTGTLITFNSAGDPTGKTEKWSTNTTLATQFAGAGWDSNRRVATWNGVAGRPFRHDQLTTAQQGALDTVYADGDDSASYLNYLRGDRSLEKTDADASSSRPYRKRAALLGDIVNSEVTPVGPPNRSFSDAVNPGYAAYKADRASRPTMVYVGANDGMLHAFNGKLDGTGAGTEQFAYVPSALFQGPTATPQVDGLAQLGNPYYQHRNYVDASPRVFDVDFNNSAGTYTSTSAATSDWHSILIGGLCKGGKGFFAIDVSDPAGITSEDVLARKVLWEFTDDTMGYSFGAPTVVKTRKYGWVVVLTSGYNNSGGAGLGYLYFVNPRTGELLEKVATSSASDGMTHAAAYVQDFSDNTADAIYAGDLNGQMWRFDVTAARGTAAAYPTATRIAVAAVGGKAQPITTPPLIEIQPKSRKRVVMFGTGQLLDPVDIGAPDMQSFYGIIDGNAAAFATFSTARTRTSLTSADLVNGTDLSTGPGWYVDFGIDSASSYGWRMIENPTTYGGLVAFATLLPTGDACSPSGKGRVYALDFTTGKSVLVGTPAGVPYASSDDAIINIKFVGVDGKARLYTGDVKGNVVNRAFTPPTPTSVRLLNWREVPTVD